MLFVFNASFPPARWLSLNSANYPQLRYAVATCKKAHIPKRHDVFAFLGTAFSVCRVMSCLDCYVACNGSREGSAGSSSTTSLSVDYPSLPGCAGARHVPPRKADATARCCAQFKNPHQRRRQPAVAAARIAGPAGRARSDQIKAT